MIVAIFLLCGMAFFSCQKNEGAEAPQAAAESEAEQPSDITIPGYAMRVATNFYVLDKDETAYKDENTKTQWKAEIPLGEEVLTGATQKMTYYGNKYDFIEVRRSNGDEGFVIVPQVVAGGRLAVVTDDSAMLHKSPSTTGMSETMLSRMSVVVYFPETQNNNFVEVRGYDIIREANILSSNSYVRASSLSTRDSDIQSAILLLMAQSLKESEKQTAAQREGQLRKKEGLLNAAFVDFPDSIFSQEIYEALEAVRNPEPSPADADQLGIENAETTASETSELADGYSP